MTGQIHTLSAVFSDSLACILTKQYNAPPENCPMAVMSGGGSICNDGTSTTNVYVNFTGTGPNDFTYAINGVPQTPITGYNWPFPYMLVTGVPGTYTLVSLQILPAPGQVQSQEALSCYYFRFLCRRFQVIIQHAPVHPAMYTSRRPGCRTTCGLFPLAEPLLPAAE